MKIETSYLILWPISPANLPFMVIPASIRAAHTMESAQLCKTTIFTKKFEALNSFRELGIVISILCNICTVTIQQWKISMVQSWEEKKELFDTLQHQQITCGTIRN